MQAFALRKTPGRGDDGDLQDGIELPAESNTATITPVKSPMGPLNLRKVDRHSSSGMEARPAPPLRLKMGKREQVGLLRGITIGGCSI
jgi:hypothetical protein